MNSRELFERRNELKEKISGLRDELKDVEDQLSDTYLPMARDMLRANNKEFGSVKLTDGNRRLKANVAKKVVWDQDMLRDALGEMSNEDARHYGKLTFAVEERKFTAAPPTIQRVLEECRTTDVGRFTIEIEED